MLYREGVCLQVWKSVCYAGVCVCVQVCVCLQVCKWVSLCSCVLCMCYLFVQVYRCYIFYYSCVAVVVWFCLGTAVMLLLHFVLQLLLVHIYNTISIIDLFKKFDFSCYILLFHWWIIIFALLKFFIRKIANGSLLCLIFCHEFYFSFCCQFSLIGLFTYSCKSVWILGLGKILMVVN